MYRKDKKSKTEGELKIKDSPHSELNPYDLFTLSLHSYISCICNYLSHISHRILQDSGFQDNKLYGKYAKCE